MAFKKPSQALYKLMKPHFIQILKCTSVILHTKIKRKSKIRYKETNLSDAFLVDIYIGKIEFFAINSKYKINIVYYKINLIWCIFHINMFLNIWIKIKVARWKNTWLIIRYEINYYNEKK